MTGENRKRRECNLEKRQKVKQDNIINSLIECTPSRVRLNPRGNNPERAASVGRGARLRRARARAAPARATLAALYHHAH